MSRNAQYGGLEADWLFNTAERRVCGHTHTPTCSEFLAHSCCVEPPPAQPELPQVSVGRSPLGRTASCFHFGDEQLSPCQSSNDKSGATGGEGKKRGGDKINGLENGGCKWKHEQNFYPPTPRPNAPCGTQRPLSKNKLLWLC